MTIQDYLIDHTHYDWPKLLVGWTWLLPPEFTVWLVNRFGDLFLVLPDDSIHLLDVGAGTLTKLADSEDEFCRKIDDGENATTWLMMPLVDRLVAADVRLQAGQCYSYGTLAWWRADFCKLRAGLVKNGGHLGGRLLGCPVLFAHRQGW